MKRITLLSLAESSAVQVQPQCKKCNTSANSVHQSKLHFEILDYDWLKDKMNFFKTNVFT